MPSKFSWSKSNRSHSSADSSSGHPSPVPSVNNEAAAQQQQQQQQPPPPNQQPPVQQIPQGAPQAAYRPQFPQRTQSHRHSAHLSIEQPHNLQAGQLPLAQASPGIDQRRGSYQPQSSTYVQQEPQKKSLRSRIAAGFGGHHKDTDEQGRHAHKNGIGRRVSVRKGDSQPDAYPSPGNDRLQAKWNQRQGSSPHLPTSNEQDEDDLDPFLQQEDPNTPQPPPKDIAYQQHPQQFAPNPHQQQYNRPPLARVSTEESYNTQGGVEHYSPEQHQGHPTTQPPPQSQYQSYQPPVQHQQNPSEYQAFHPQAAPSPHLGNAQHQSQDLTQQQNYLKYQHQQPQPQAQQAQQQPPQDSQQPPPHYQQQPQQQQFAPTPQPHQSQDFHKQHVQQGRPPSQQLQDVQGAQAAQQIPQIVQQGQQIDTQHLQQRRPPSAHQQRAPPSPSQQPPQYQAYDAQQQGHPAQATDTHAQNTTPPQQGQDNMPPAGGQHRNTLRKVNDAGGPPPGAPSRESSLLQQPPAQGQTHGQPPVSPGVATFGANVVPTASQGQPYRGEKQGQQGQGNELGRATPPPRSANDMSDEEIQLLVKEHDMLREKYQKVKRYFFEQQSQVHQLQNTLAHQRLSLSRTSWDDSEYATRFNRLDGLIAQLSFAIRKDWKSIPPYLHPVVNKNAVETGKQEMTAVGRAFISAWLVENIFDKYFHPDLEPGLSTQLKTIQLNIRKFSPVCQTSEDEEALVGKVINWRLATLEGLAELLRSPQAPIIRESLIESLNENLIGSLQMHLNEPAPPDLNGGIPMIIELAVNVAQHLPLESRDVHIEYYPPGHSLVSEFMKVESGIPALTNPIADSDDTASLRSVASKVDDASSIAEQDQQAQQANQAPKEADKKRGMFGFGSSKKPTQTPASLGKRESSLGQGGSQQSLTQPPPGSSSGPKDEPPPPRVRLAVGMAVQIRGKSILIKAPVYST